ncbi:N-acetyltransferase [Clostridium sp. D2Q-11]|uniref:N-acetyltransferase n=1 Tax=Anaeromonas frigoriresistens TaxID=2683708 RepID=A0A942Z7D0_9FIRM|nr:GNAT family N-acetyltransferase [Anaeromonas frigoriresistens]MBS4537128.1 N-acetyltransferase [Anaeromonas frigoriresistens]
MIIRKSKKEDINRITEIYNEAVLHSIATMDIDVRDEKGAMIWYEDHNERYPILVAEVSGEVIGWISLSSWSNKKGYDPTIEISIYIENSFRSKGIGNKLFHEGIEIAKKLKYHSIIARIAGANQKSIYLHEKYGFNHIGTMKEAGFKFSKYIDIYIYQLILD